MNDVRLLDLRRHPAHTAGVQGFALALAREAAAWRRRGVDHRLLVWQNAAEAEERFAVNGRRHTIRPDARFRYRMDGAVCDLLLEWDRGVVRRRDYARKLAAYAAYVTIRPVGASHTRLLIATSGAALDRVRTELLRAGKHGPGLLTITSVMTHEDVYAERITAALRGRAGA